MLCYFLKYKVLCIKNISSEIQFKQIKSFFEKFGFLSRIFFTKHSKNIKNFKIQKIYPIIGWIEYLNKKDAKHAVEYFKKYTLNSYLPTDILVEYLRNFSWDELIGFFC